MAGVEVPLLTRDKQLQLLANLTVVARIPPRLNPPKFVFKSYLVPFRSRHFQLLSLSMVSYLGLFLPLTYIIVQAEQEGVAEGLADKMLVIVNASSRMSSIFAHSKQVASILS